MSREVCGICWCPYDEETGACGCEPASKEHGMTTLRTAAQQALEVLVRASSYYDTYAEIEALRAALAKPEPPIGKASTDVGVPVYVLKKAEPVQEPQCNPHPKAPHSFMRNASHNEDRYVCECEGWEPYEAGYQAGMEAALRAQS